MLSDHTKIKNDLEAENKKVQELVEQTKAQSQNDKLELETQYRDKINLMEKKQEQLLQNHAKSSDEVTEKMQKEIESIQVTWQEEQHKLIMKLQNEHELTMQSLQNEHKNAIEVLESKLTAAIDESMALKLKAEV